MHEAVANMTDSLQDARKNRDFCTRFDTASIKAARVDALPLVMIRLSAVVGIGSY